MAQQTNRKQDGYSSKINSEWMKKNIEITANNRKLPQ